MYWRIRGGHDVGRDCRTRLGETKFPGANGDRKTFVSPFQLTTSRICNLARLILLLLYVITIHTYIKNRYVFLRGANNLVRTLSSGYRIAIADDLPS